MKLEKEGGSCGGISQRWIGYVQKRWDGRIKRDAARETGRRSGLRAAPSGRKRDSPRRDERFVAGDWRLKEQPRTMQLPWP